MTKKDFFILTIKLFGLMSLVTSLFSGIPNSISFALMNIDVFSLIWIIGVVLVAVGLFVLLVFKADKVVEVLKLDKGFDEERIELGNLNSVELVKIGTFIIGGLLILDNISSFLSHIFLAFKESVVGQTYGPNEKFYLIVSGLNIIVGYLLVTNYSFIASLLNKANHETKKSTEN